LEQLQVQRVAVVKSGSHDAAGDLMCNLIRDK